MLSQVTLLFLPPIQLWWYFLDHEGMGMKVAIDVTAAVTQRAGVARYTRELVSALAQLPDGPELQPFAVTVQKITPLDEHLPVACVHQSVNVRYGDMLVRHVLRRPARGPWDGADVYHAEVLAYPPVRNMPVVSVVHDLAYYVYPQHQTRLYGTYLRHMTPVFLARAQRIVAVSAATKQDLMERSRVPDHKICVVYPGIAKVFRQPVTPEHLNAVRDRYRLPSTFLLSVGTLEPRKNLQGTLQAYRLFRQRHSDAPPLLLVGATGWRLDERSLLGGADDHVRRLGYVPDEDLAALYTACGAFVYPSFYEGFGLPVVEAMALGAPTITSRVSSLPEVAGDAAVLVDPQQPEEIATAMERILSDQALRSHLRRAGMQRAQDFSYNQCAMGMMNVYREAAG
jgi:glycosyltransferase involved in cell wall biosynthesis